MKKIVLSLTLAAFIGGGTLFAMTTTHFGSESVAMEMIQDGSKKKEKTTKKEECKGEKSSDKKSDCKGNDVLKKKAVAQMVKQPRQLKVILKKIIKEQKSLLKTLVFDIGFFTFHLVLPLDQYVIGVYFFKTKSQH